MKSCKISAFDFLVCRTKDDRVSGCDDSCFCDTHVVKRCWPGSAIDGICADSKTFSGSRGKLEFEGKCPTGFLIVFF